MLTVDRLCAGYGGGTVLHEVNLRVPPGQRPGRGGTNGAGKSTLVHTIAGLVDAPSGRIGSAASTLAGRPAHRIAQAGVGLVPQGRRVFARLTVAEHLAPGGRAVAGPPPAASWTVARTLELLPRLAVRLRHRGSQLSGGEQQMLAIARALLGPPAAAAARRAVRGPRASTSRPGSASRQWPRRPHGLTVLLVEQQLRARPRRHRPLVYLENGILRAVTESGETEHRRGSRNFHVSIGRRGAAPRVTSTWPSPARPGSPDLARLTEVVVVARMAGGATSIIAVVRPVGRRPPDAARVRPRRSSCCGPPHHHRRECLAASARRRSQPGERSRSQHRRLRIFA